METQSAIMAAVAASVLLLATLERRRDATALHFALLLTLFGSVSAAHGAASLGLGGAPLAEALALSGLPAALVALAERLAGRSLGLRGVSAAMTLGSLALAAAVLGLGPGRPGVSIALAGYTWLGSALGAWIVWPLQRPTRDPSSPERTRLRYVAAVQLGLPVAIAIDAACAFAGAPQIAAPLAGTAYAAVAYLYLTRVRVVDVRELATQALALALLAALLSALFTGLSIAVGPRLDLFAFDAFVASFALLMLSPVIRRTLRRAVERRFGTRKRELERSLEPLRERLTQILSLDDLIREWMATLQRTERVTTSCIYLRDDPRLGFQQAASLGLRPRARISLIRDPVLVAALEAGGVLSAEELDALFESGPRAERRDRGELREVLRQLDAQLILPLRTATQLVGFWTLTDSRSQEAFSTREIELLGRVAERMAVCIENSKTFARIRARDRYASLGEMAAGLAHEIRNPLAAIRGALAVLDVPPSGEARALHEVIRGETDRLDRVVGTFLDYTHPDVRATRIDDLGECVRAITEGFLRRASRPGIAFELSLAEDLPPVAFDTDQLDTVLTNVLRNAYQALEPSGDPGQVRVEVSPTAGDTTQGTASGVEISVEDDGPGLSPEILERAFVPFFTTRERGTGLGLAICERLVRTHGGSIRLQPRPGGGTRVTMGLRAWAEPSPSAESDGAGIA
ncbi:MAG: nitrogen regulation protein NR(II) [Myxococcota bacterium]